MKVTPIVILFNLFFVSSFAESAIPVVSKETKFVSAVVKPVLSVRSNNLECAACQFLTKELDDKLFHNEHLIEIAQSELDNICNILPADAKDICFSAVNNTVPELLGKIGDYVEEKGCDELGICKNEK